MSHRLSSGRLSWGLAGAVGLSLALAACGPSRTSGPQPVYQEQPQAVVTSDGTQQFPVPQSGRELLAQRLMQLVPGRIVDARISNGWRTAAAAQQHPDDYAACVSADAGGGSKVFLIVTNGSHTGDVISGDKASQRCADGARVTQWTTLPEAISRS
ncbi:hypothetical protein GCM10007874_67410 [Labrys miyagiensis]|uniref:Uncharacterized protein n=1 Tax=Labrys miyagiensis TaxID=346912 RepID=A0ABQ6CUB2_9HYPH|nr:hypothetical protein [Labrys miyagiensis]GLS23720.1 hypothetical protein GCM10007874_67410 [Labrys miyagiensis]